MFGQYCTINSPESYTKEDTITFIYHGTTKENFEKIKEHGFQTTRPLVWNHSNKDQICFYYDTGYGLYNEDPILNNLEIRKMAIYDAQITAALQHSASTSLYLIGIDIPYGVLESFIEKYTDRSEDTKTCTSIALPIQNLDLSTWMTSVTEIKNGFLPSFGLCYLANTDITKLNTQILDAKEQTILTNKRKTLQSLITWDMLYQIDLE